MAYVSEIVENIVVTCSAPCILSTFNNVFKSLLSEGC